jgi:hypothetical protein
LDETTEPRRKRFGCARQKVINSESRRDKWEEQLRHWVEAPGGTEHEKCENAERVVREAILAHDGLRALGNDVEVFSQGSFRNGTNILQKSRVDISVCFKRHYLFTLPLGGLASDFRIGPPSFSYDAYRNTVTKALRNSFGSENIAIGNKAIRVHSSTHNLDMNVVPDWEHVEFFDLEDISNTRKGVAFLERIASSMIVSYPKEHTASVWEKNRLTGGHFSRIVRVLKSLQEEMLERGLVGEPLPSFLIESLLYNTPNVNFEGASYYTDLCNALLYLVTWTHADPRNISRWVEANEMRFLFSPSQRWDPVQCHAFLSKALDYISA